jgi:hypothetical protein
MQGLQSISYICIGDYVIKQLIEEALFFRAKDIKKLLKSPNGGSASYSWNYGDKKIGSMRYTVYSDKPRVVLSFYANGENKPTFQHIILDKQPRYFGGFEYYFLCPGCGRRASILPSILRMCSSIADDAVIYDTGVSGPVSSRETGTELGNHARCLVPTLIHST